MGAPEQTENWYVVRTRLRSDILVRERLEERGTRVFVPTRRREVYNRRMRKWRTYSEPLMPGYAFVRANPSNWRQILGVRDVLYVLGSVDKDGIRAPTSVKDDVVERLIADIAAGVYDDTRESRRIRGEHADLMRVFRTGEAVALRDGPLSTLAGTVKDVNSNGSIRVLVELLGRMVPVHARAGQLQVAARP